MSKDLNPGAGYRLLDYGDVIQEGDEVWVPEEASWSAIKDQTPGDKIFLRYFRRKIKPADGWVKLSDKLPDKFPCWVSDGNGVWLAESCYSHGGKPLPDGWPCVGFRTLDADQRLTVWQSAARPEPPKPEVGAEEIAFEAWWRSKIWWPKSSVAIEPAKAAWLAALQYAKDEADRKGPGSR
jgi:hypothetical protein